VEEVMKKDFIFPAECNKCKKAFDLVIKAKHSDTPIEKVFQEMFGGSGIYCGACNGK
jgi:hypothetical protein